MFEKVKRVIHSFCSSRSLSKELALLFLKEQQKRKSKERRSERANSQPCIYSTVQYIYYSLNNEKKAQIKLDVGKMFRHILKM